MPSRYSPSPRPCLYGAEYQGARRGVLLLNLGSPDSPAVEDVHRYLDEFLMDRRVIGLTQWVRYLLVKKMIVPRRAPRSAESYATIWDERAQNFPLITHSAAIAEQLSALRHEPVALGMRYGSPTTGEALEALASMPALEELVIAPLYPHYARSSYETAVAYALSELRRLGLGHLRVRLLAPFYADERYREALAASVRPYLEEPFDRLIVSMHGIPTSHIPKACRHDNGVVGGCASRRSWHERWGEEDCYRLQCEETKDYLCLDLGLAPDKVELVYQSRLGIHEWMRPYMSERIHQLVPEGVKRVVVVCPGFVCDCLETVQEIDDYYHGIFEREGGERFSYVPCLNSSPAFIQSLSELVTATLADPAALLSEENKRKYKH